MAELIAYTRYNVIVGVRAMTEQRGHTIGFMHFWLFQIHQSAGLDWASLYLWHGMHAGWVIVLASVYVIRCCLFCVLASNLFLCFLHFRHLVRAVATTIPFFSGILLCWLPMAWNRTMDVDLPGNGVTSVTGIFFQQDVRYVELRWPGTKTDMYLISGEIFPPVQ